jgi:hypothetical protein
VASLLTFLALVTLVAQILVGQHGNREAPIIP